MIVKLPLPTPAKGPPIATPERGSQYRRVLAGCAGCAYGTYTYSTPSYRSLDQDRALTLVYSSATTALRGLVALDVDANSTTAPDRISISLLKPDGQLVTLSHGQTEMFYTGGPGPSRITAQFDGWAYGTGLHAMTAIVRNWWGPTMLETRLPVQVIMVNHRASEFGSGWTVAGLQRLYPSPSATGDALLVDGATAVRFPFASAGRWTAPPGGADVLVTSAPGIVERRSRDGTVATFEAASGRMTQVRDRLGLTTSFGYDGAGRLTSITDPAGLVTTIRFTPMVNERRTAQITTPGGRVSRVEIEPTSLVGDIFDPDGVRAMAAGYTSDHLLTITVDRLGAWRNIAYDLYGGLASVTGPVVDTRDLGNGSRAVTTYRSREAALLPAPGTGTSAAPAARVLPSSVWLHITSPRGNDVAIQSNGAGDATMTVTTDAQGKADTTAVGYDAADRIATVWSTTGTRLEYVWDGDLLRSETDNTTGVSTAYEHNSYGQVTTATINQTVVQRNVYSADVRSLLQSSTSGNATTSYVYDALGRVSSVTDGAQHRTAFTYAPGGFRNLASVTRNWSQTTTFAHDGFGRVSSVTNALGQTSSVGYDLLNRTTSTTAPGRGSSSWGYDDVGRQYTFTDARGQQYRTVVNALGTPVEQTGPASPLRDLVRYDSDGNPSSYTTWAGRTGRTVYDPLGRPITISADGAPTTTIAYDPARKWIAYGNAESIDTVFVDGAGRVTKQVAVRNGTPYTITSSFGPQGDRQTLAVVSPIWGGTVRALYFNVDSFGRQSYIGDFVGTGTTIAYNQDHQPQTITLPTGPGTAAGRLRQSLTYAANERLATMGTNLGLAALTWAFYYDVLDRTTLRQQGFYPNPTRRALDYDAGGRLAHWRDSRVGQGDPVWNCPYPYNDDWCAPDYPIVETTVREERYTYDAVGNRTGLGVSTAAGNRLTSVNGYTMAYDADGNLESKSGNGHAQTFTWNGLGQLAQVVTDGVTTTFGYDGVGRRVRKTTNGVTTSFLYDGANMVMQLDATGRPQLEFSYYPGVDHPHAVRKSATGAVYYYVTTPPGHVTALVNQSNQVVNQYEYTPFGQANSTTEGIVQPFRFGGREWDAETGLYYNRARYYDPTLARFISEDPIGLAGGVNPYAYAKNNPVDGRDPSGTCTLWHVVETTYYDDGSWERKTIGQFFDGECAQNGGGGGGGSPNKQGKPRACSVQLTPRESLAVADVTRRTRASRAGNVIETGAWTFPVGPNVAVPTKGASFLTLGPAALKVPAGAKSLVHYHPSHGTVWDNNYGSLSREDTLYAIASGLQRIIAASRDSLSLWAQGGRITTCPR